MPEAISNTSPLLYLHRIGMLEWLPQLFDEVWAPNAVVMELQEGRRRGYDVPDPGEYAWLQIIEPQSVPFEWLSLDLATGELQTMALALENPDRIVLLDDALARRIPAWRCGERFGYCLKRNQGLIEETRALITRLQDTGMWISDDIRQRVLALAGEAP